VGEILNSRERIRLALELKIPDRVPLVEYSYWPSTIERWHAEGLPEDADPVKYLGMDSFLFVSYDDCLGLEMRTLCETGEKVARVDSDGATFVYWKNSYAPPQPLDFLIKTEEDWYHYKHCLIPGEDRLGKDFVKNYKKLRETDGFICLSQREPCWKVLAAMMGLEKGLLYMFRNPQLVYDMMETYADLLLGMYDIIAGKGVEIDGVYLRGDLAYKKGMLFSPELYDRLLYPHHKRITNFFRSKGIPVIHHIDGDVRQYIPLIIKSGFNAIEPLESRANNDVRELKERWGTKIAFMGNISVEALSGTKLQIEEEIRSKVVKAKEGGGYIFTTDGSVPPIISWSNYCYAVKIAKEVGQY